MNSPQLICIWCSLKWHKNEPNQLRGWEIIAMKRWEIAIWLLHSWFCAALHWCLGKTQVCAKQGSWRWDERVNRSVSLLKLPHCDPNSLPLSHAAASPGSDRVIKWSQRGVTPQINKPLVKRGLLSLNQVFQTHRSTFRWNRGQGRALCC